MTANPGNCSLRSGVIALLVGLFFAQVALGQTWDYSVYPKAKENFLAASFRYTRLSGTATSNTVLVYVPGTDGDGRGAVSDSELLEIATKCHADLLGCYFRGEGLSYDDPSKGSGRALQEALSYFEGKTGYVQAKPQRLLLVGFSEGGMFVFNYVCLYPDHVSAFASLRAIFPRFKPRSSSLQVPGLLAAGESDEPGRVRAIASAFEEAEGPDSRWAFLLEKQSGHETGKSLELARSLFEAICLNGQITSPVYLDTLAKAPLDPGFNQAHRCWFPNAMVAGIWKSLHQPETLANLDALPDPPHLQNAISIQQTPEIYRCENGGREVGSIRISSRDSKIFVGQIRVIGDGFTVDGPQVSGHPEELKVCFAPKNMAWGETRATVIVGGGPNGDSVRAILFGMVKGVVTPIPSTLYLGVVAPGQEVQKTIHLRSSASAVHFSDIQTSNGVTAVVKKSNEGSDLLLQVRWIGGNRLGSMQGDIELNVDSPEKGTLMVPVYGFVALTRS